MPYRWPLAPEFVDEGLNRSERYPWVILDPDGYSICYKGSINPGHWKSESGLCRCYDIAIFKFKTGPEEDA